MKNQKALLSYSVILILSVALILFFLNAGAGLASGTGIKAIGSVSLIGAVLIYIPLIILGIVGVYGLATKKTVNKLPDTLKFGLWLVLIAVVICVIGTFMLSSNWNIGG